MNQKHIVTSTRELQGEYPEVLVSMASGRDWRFRRTHVAKSYSSTIVTKDHLMGCSSSSTRPTWDHTSEYKVAKAAASSALISIEDRRRETAKNPKPENT